MIYLFAKALQTKFRANWVQSEISYYVNDCHPKPMIPSSSEVTKLNDRFGWVPTGFDSGLYFLLAMMGQQRL